MSDPILQVQTEVPSIAYGIDIGVYRHGVNETVLSTTTFAWARAESSVRLMLSLDNESETFSFDGSYTSGRDMRDFAELVTRDLKDGKKIAIGIEAPMWQPAPTQISPSRFDLLPVRFPQEKGFEWYRQSGAGALAKGLSTGRLLFSLLDVQPEDIRCAIGPFENANIELFEGFVVDRWKLRGDPAFGDGAHAWDALTTAVGFHYANQSVEENKLLSLIHKARSCGTPVISHWETILNSLDLDVANCQTDCMVVGFDSSSEAVRQAASKLLAQRVEKPSSHEAGTGSSS